MTYPHRLSRRVALSALFCLPLSLVVAAGRPISETDIFSFQWMANPRISPDGSRDRLRARQRKFEARRLRHRAMDDTLGGRRSAAIDQRAARFVAAMVAGRQAAGVRAIAGKRRQSAASANLSAGDGRRRSAAANRYAEGG